MSKKWHDDEIIFIKENYMDMTDAEMAVILERTVSSVSSKRKSLKLKRGNRKYSFDDVVKEFDKTEYELISGPEDYHDAAQNTLKYICPKHRDKGIMTISLGHLQSGRGCYYCGREITEAAHRIDLNNNERYKNICEEKDLIFVEAKRIDGKICVGFKCPNHLDVGVQYMPYYNLKRPTAPGCPYCHSSKWEEGIRLILSDLNVNYTTQKKFDDLCNEKPLRFDFFLEDQNKAIEYDGRHHFEPVCFNGLNKDIAFENFKKVKILDEIKNEYCIDHNIQLLRIPYYDYDKAEELIKNFVE